MVIMKAFTCLTLTEEEFHDELAKYLDTLECECIDGALSIDIWKNVVAPSSHVYFGREVCVS